jgi:hypothetical protein
VKLVSGFTLFKLLEKEREQTNHGRYVIEKAGYESSVSELFRQHQARMHQMRQRLDRYEVEQVFETEGSEAAQRLYVKWQSRSDVLEQTVQEKEEVACDSNASVSARVRVHAS